MSDRDPVPTGKTRREPSKPAKEAVVEPGPDLRDKVANPKKRKRRTEVREATQPLPPRKSRKEMEDDAEIAALENKLGLKGKKLPKSFEQDGLGDVLGTLAEEEDGRTGKRKSTEDAAWLLKKRRFGDIGRAIEGKDDDLLREEDDSDEDLYDGSNVDTRGAEVEAGSEDDEDSTSEGEGETPHERPESGRPEPAKSAKSAKRENPYVAPTTGRQEPTAKYVPPSLRKTSTSDAEITARLRRQTQGLLNRLSEANILSILSDVEKLYTGNPRRYVNATLVDLLTGLTCDASALNDTFLILHAGFITAVYKVFGSDFGAQMLERLVERFDQHYSSDEADKDEGGKETGNIVSLLSQLYNLQMISSVIILDHIRLFLSSISERHTELLLRIIRASGPQLRQDHPSALKDIATTLQRKVVAAANENTAVSVRTRFMVETITSLKDNKLKQGIANSALMSEHIIRMKKTLGSMNNRTLKASEPLSISLADIRAGDKRGKWWLVGASWRGPGAASTTKHPASLDPGGEEIHEDADDYPLDPLGTDITHNHSLNHPLPTHPDSIAALASQNRMNTPLRRAIFTTLLSATDAHDAHTRLLKLALTHKQQLEIPRVLLHCLGAEAAAAGEEGERGGYNPYYELVTIRVCRSGGKQVVMAFVYCLWDLFKRLRGSGTGSSIQHDDDDDSDDPEDADEATTAAKMTTASLAHHARFYGQLLANHTLPISLLKPLDLIRLSASMSPSRSKPRAKLSKKDTKTRLFIEVLLMTTLRHAARRSRSDLSATDANANAKTRKRLEKIFAPAKEIEGLGAGLALFLEKVVKGSDLLPRGSVRDAVGDGVLVVREVLWGEEAGGLGRLDWG